MQHLQEAAFQLNEAVQFAKTANNAQVIPGGHWAIHDIEYQVHWFELFGTAESGCWSQLQPTLPR